MKLFDEINHFLTLKEVEKNIFYILSLYDNQQDNHECLNLIEKLITKIKSSICEYQKTKDDSLYNIIDNDFYTLKALFEEYKKEVYPLFPVKSLALLSTFKHDELKKIYKYLIILNKDIGFIDIKTTLRFAIIKTIDYFEDQNYQQKIKDFLNNNELKEPHFETVISSIKQQKKILKNEKIDHEYLNLIAIYFYYLYKEVK